MNIDTDRSQPEGTTELRRRALDKMNVTATTARPVLNPAGPQRLLHELQIHQLELEMQTTELREARDEREAVLLRYTNLYDFAPVGYFTLGREGSINALNLAGSSLLGIERSGLIGQSFGQFVTIDDRPAFTAFLDRVFTCQGKETCELRLLKGTRRPLFVLVEAVAAASGEGLECLVAIIDVSAHRQQEEKLEILHTDLSARAADLEAANIELEAFNYTVSHDLRIPLTIINGYCQVIEDFFGSSLDKQCRDYNREIYEGSLRMTHLIDTLLDFSRVTRTPMRHEKVDLSSIVENLATVLNVMEPERHVTFKITPGINVSGDAGLLRTVLNNLVSNAWKYTAGSDSSCIEFGVTESAGRPAYFVRDNGPGFDMLHAEKMFLPFQRLAGEEVEGHGIGLATVKRIIDRHNGRIWVESKPGEGAAFYFSLP